MSLVGLDLTSSRMRAVVGPSSQRFALATLEDDSPELPLVVALEDRGPAVGRAGFRLLRLRPHQAAAEFLPALGTAWHKQSGKVRVDAAQAMSLAFAALPARLGKTSGTAATVPAYLGEHQIAVLYELAAHAGLSLTGSIAAPVAAVLATPAVLHDAGGLVLVVESDGFSLTWSVVERDQGIVRLRFIQPSPVLGRLAWIRRLVECVADRCVRQCRRDPRETAATEQHLFEQVCRLLDQPATALVQVHVQGNGWTHHMMFHTDELAAFVAPLLRQASADLDAVRASVDQLGHVSSVIVTHAAASLPGLTALLTARFATADAPGPPATADDFGDALLEADRGGGRVHVLAADALAATAHELAVRIHRGEFPKQHLDAIALPGARQPESRDTGRPRLAFRGQEHELGQGTFVLGRDPGCHLVFETELYPHVSGRHAEIVFDRRAFVLYDRSRHGTWLNDHRVSQQQALHSGDWIRLGPLGPVIRFLGEAE